MPAKLTQNQFIERVTKLHPEYDFSESVYKSNRTKVKLKCNKHGYIYKYAQDLMRGGKCGICFLKSKKHGWDLNKFIHESKIKHDDKFDYSLVDYKNQVTNINIICKHHGIFNIRPENFLKSKYGCKHCGNEGAGKNNPKFIKFLNLEKESGISYKDYKNKVIYHTEHTFKNNKNIIDPQNLRGWEYHLDHYIPISYGFKNKVPPILLGNINNLSILDKISNIKKSDKIDNIPLWYISEFIKYIKLNKNENCIDRNTQFWENIISKFS